VFQLAPHVKRIVGIDSADGSIELARDMAGTLPAELGSRCEFATMDALELDYEDNSIDAVICVQNGVCAFGVDQAKLLREALRVTRVGGKILFSTYLDKFWLDRLAWFQEQAAAGLLGAIDYEATGDGVIACCDGFRSGRLSHDDWRSLCAHVGYEPKLVEVDESCLFCEITKVGDVDAK
jgi:SAM-dependent methyltransferase